MLVSEISLGPWDSREEEITFFEEGQRTTKGTPRLRVRGLSLELLFGGLWYFLPLPLFYTQRRYKEYTQHGLRKEKATGVAYWKRSATGVAYWKRSIRLGGSQAPLVCSFTLNVFTSREL
ncbi:hypothetical protein VIGAN_04127600 [Vigna angularis var. angularis]|uniref:Uncharacterized protein n=1 Tax=Vigna angularis var. angularis TaxID=157739 RepID=A0A0S3RTX4_PHAAN|nr:hypothetical protein VIGAN_04127600 [Vigna angularis var. angularis]